MLSEGEWIWVIGMWLIAVICGMMAVYYNRYNRKE